MCSLKILIILPVLDINKIDHNECNVIIFSILLPEHGGGKQDNNTVSGVIIRHRQLVFGMQLYFKQTLKKGGVGDKW